MVHGLMTCKLHILYDAIDCGILYVYIYILMDVFIDIVTSTVQFFWFIVVVLQSLPNSLGQC